MQRRNDIKVPINISISLSGRAKGETISNVAATIWNISAGGVFFTSKQEFSIGDVVSFRFSTPDLPSIALQVEVLRIQEHRGLRKIIGARAEDTELRGYGCRFIRLPGSAESQIRNYVFRQDLIHRRWVSALD